MCFDHIHPLPQLFPDHQVPKQPTFCLFFFIINHVVQFVLPLYSWTCSLLLKHSGSTKGIFLKIDSPSPGSIQLLIAPHLVVCLVTISLLHDRILYGLSWPRVYVSYHNNYESMPATALLCPEKDCTLVIIHASTLTFFQPPFLKWSPSLGQRVVIRTSHLGMRNMQLLSLCTLTSCESLC